MKQNNGYLLEKIHHKHRYYRQYFKYIAKNRASSLRLFYMEKSVLNLRSTYLFRTYCKIYSKRT